MRTLDIDVLKCPTAGCAGRMVVLAFLTDPRVLARVLDHIGLPSVPPPLAPPRFQTDLDFDLDFDLDPAQRSDVDSWDDDVPMYTADCEARPPPRQGDGSARTWFPDAGAEADDPYESQGGAGH